MTSKRRNITRMIVKGAAADSELDASVPPGARVLHRFGDKLSVAAMAETTSALNPLEALPPRMDVERLGLNDTEQLALHALRLAQTPEYKQAKLKRPAEGEDWDFGLEAPLTSEDLGDDQFVGGISGAEGGNTSARLVGKVAVSIVFVEGPTPDTKITDEERIKVWLECTEGFSWIAAQEPDANLSFYWEYESVEVNVHPGQGGHWNRLPVAFQKDLDAVVDRKDNGKIYMFKGDQYVRFSDVSTGVDEGYPKPIAGNWNGLPASFQQGIDAALYRDSNDKLYFFKGDQYVRFTGSTMDASYPKPIAGNWDGMPSRFNVGIDAAVWLESNSKIYFFKDTEYVRFSDVSAGVDEGYPKPIAGNWAVPPDWDSGIDAALMRRSNSKLYFFEGQNYIRLTSPRELDLGYPLAIGNDKADREELWRNPAMQSLGFTADWNGVKDYVASLRTDKRAQWALVGFFTRYPLKHFAYARRPRIVMSVDNGNWGMDNIDRVFLHETGHIFSAPDEYASSNCTCGGTYGFFGQPNDNCANCAVSGAPCIMKSNDWEICDWTPGHIGWETFLTGIDAAFWRISNGRIYLFSGPWYVRLTDNTSDGPESGYPRKIAGNWRGLPSSFNDGIDAALMRESNGKIYFFKDDQYVRIGDDSRVESGYPKPIVGNWKDLPDAFSEGIDAALWRESNGKIYFFKGSQYVRIGDDSAMEAGYPKPIAGNWKGAPEAFQQGFDAILLRRGNGKIYAFKGRRYIRWTDLSAGMDSGYPNWIHGNWMAFPK